MIQDRIKELRRVKASTLLANPLNYRKHPPRQKALLSQLLSEVGYADALLAYETPEGLRLIDGHLRAETTPDQEVPVLVLDVTEQEANKLLLTLDPLAGLAETDAGLLGELLKSTETTGDLAAWMEERAEEVGIANDPAEEPAEIPPDRYEEVLKKYPVQPGDIWQLGKHRLLCGDSRVRSDVLRLLDGATPHLMVTDPPYGVEYDPNWRNEALRADGSPIGARAIGTVENDGEADWTGSWMNFPGDVAYVWCASLHVGVVQKSIEQAGFEVRSSIIWAKNMFAIGRGDYHWRHEPCWYAVRKGKTGHWNGDRSQTTVWEIDKPHKSESGHSTQKPIECMARPIRNNSTPGDSVYEPFAGSGTTLLAAEELGRSCFAIEIRPEYCAVICERWHKQTGGTPVRIDSLDLIKRGSDG